MRRGHVNKEEASNKGLHSPGAGRRGMSREPLAFDVGEEARRIEGFIRSNVRQASAKGVVVALSGGIDSAVVGSLCARALGADKVLALLLPSDHTPKVDEEDARALAKSWGVKSVRIPISPITKAVIEAAEVEGTKIARANVEARTRMIMNYYYANTLSFLVAGTGDRSEILEGYYTKFGDGGADFLPIAHLYKSQVRALGTQLGLPRRIVEKPASPQLWPGQKASDELPEEYDKLDVILQQLFDLKGTPEDAAKAAGVPRSVVERVDKMNRDSAHKRAMPPSLG